MANEAFAWMSAVEIRELVAAGQVSPVEIVQACLERIESADPELHSFITVAADHALEQARSAEAAVAGKQPLGPLHGVPVALKDEARTRGIPSTGGSLVFRRFVPEQDGTVAERLRAAGAVIVGKTQLPEFAAWPRSKTRLGPESVNPWDRTRISGASSGGSAAAVAAGLVPLAVGSDGGGSIRIPSALCGTVGLYPTPGRVPSYGSFSYVPAGSLGPMGRSVRDVAVLQNVIAGPDARDACALSSPAPDALAGLERGVRGLRVAWSEDFGHIPVQPAVARAVQAAALRLAELGAVVEELREPLLHPWANEAAMAAMQEAVANQEWKLPDDPGPLPDIGPELAWMWATFSGAVPFTASGRFRTFIGGHRGLLAPHSQVSAGLPPPGEDDERALEERRVQILAAMAAVFEHHDVLCSPTMNVVAPTAPPGWRSPYADPYMGTNFTFVANTAGCPAASVPCGLAGGLPVGLQIIGRPGDEPTVLRVGNALERAFDAEIHPALL